MKHPLSGLLLLASVISSGAFANCLKGADGQVICGKGQCEKDSYGKVFCADAGGGAMKDMYGKVVCGIGYCAKDYLNKVWCSTTPDGGAAADSRGEVKCLDGCEPASAEICRAGQ